MAYDFDETVNRRGTWSLKWDVPEGVLPMWVADMDFKAAPEIREDFENRVKEGVFGYQIVPDEWYEAYQGWWERRHHVTLQKEGLVFTTGVVPAISSAVRKLTTPNERVVILSPVYNIFYNSILNNGCRVLESKLKYRGTGYEIDWKDLESKLADPETTLLIFCNPHNPIGKIWDKETLAKIGDLCAQYHVTVLADEIHCDLTDPGKEYVPFISASETCRRISITLIAPTKCFNLAGLQSAAVYAENEGLRHKIWRALNTDEVAEPNALAVAAAVSAFTKGEAWLDELRQYIYDNKQLVRDFVMKEIPEVYVVPSEATYLLWLDMKGLKRSPDWSRQTPLGTVLEEYLYKEAGLYLTSGAEYGSGGEDFLRMNVATSRANVEEGLKRLNKGLGKYLYLS